MQVFFLFLFLFFFTNSLLVGSRQGLQLPGNIFSVHIYNIFVCPLLSRFPLDQALV